MIDNPIADIVKNLHIVDEIFVICKDEKTIRRLMREFADCFDSDYVRVCFDSNKIRFGNEIYIFTTCTKQELALQARRNIQVVYDYDFQKAIVDYKAMKLMEAKEK